MARGFTSASSHYVSYPNATSIDLSPLLLVGCWCRFPSTPPNNSAIFSKRSGGVGSGVGYDLTVDNGAASRVKFAVETDAVAEVSTTITNPGLFDGNWHYLAAEWKSTGRIRIWVDSSSLGTVAGPASGNGNTTNPLVVGAGYNGSVYGNFIDAEICELVVYDELNIANYIRDNANGMSPIWNKVFPLFYAPMYGGDAAANDPDRVGLLTATVSGAAAVSHAPVTQPDSGFVVTSPGTMISALLSGQSGLTVGIYPDVPIASAVSAASTVASAAIANRGISSQSSASSSVSALANFEALAAADMPGSSTVAVTATADFSASADIDADGSLAARLSADWQVASSVAGASSIASTVRRQTPLSGAVNGASSLSVDADCFSGVSVAFSGQSVVDAGLSADVPVYISVAASSLLSAKPTKAGELAVDTVGGTVAWQ